MNALIRYITFFIFSAVFIESSVLAEVLRPMIPEPTIHQCAQLLKECHAKSDIERANCFYSSARHPFCEGTDLGKLAYKRWVMSPVKNGGMQSAPALLGPAIIDQECLQNFDSLWLSKLIAPETLEGSVASLNDSLSKCTKELSEQLTRP